MSKLSKDYNKENEIVKCRILNIPIGSIFKCLYNNKLYIRIKGIEIRNNANNYCVNLKTGDLEFSNNLDEFEFIIYRYG